jgi:hypothetical protein
MSKKEEKKNKFKLIRIGWTLTSSTDGLQRASYGNGNCSMDRKTTVHMKCYCIVGWLSRLG